MKLILLWLIWIVTLAGCQTAGPAVDSVWAKTRIMTVPAGEQDAFLSDRASGLKTEGKFLSPEQQGEEFFVQWHGDQIDLVKFEYRQLHAPDKISSQQYQPQSQHSHVFTITGEAYRRGGTISGWRASLWRRAPAGGGDDQFLAELKSSLW